jgi:hypothetical protein
MRAIAFYTKRRSPTNYIKPIAQLEYETDRARLTLQIAQMSREELIAQFQPPRE